MEKTFNEKRIEFLGLLDLVADEATTGEGEEAVVTIVKARLIVLAEELLKKAKKGSGIKVDSNQQKFRRLLLASVITEENPEALGYLTERQIFDEFSFGFGRHEALTACRNMHIRVADGEETIWAQDVELEDGSIVYKVLGVGAEMPDTYKIRRKKGGSAPVEVVEVAEPEPVNDDEFEKELAEMDIH